MSDPEQPQLSPLHATDGATIGVGTTFAETTRYRALRDRLEHSKERLETAYEELQSTNEELETTASPLASPGTEPRGVTSLMRDGSDGSESGGSS